jgi:hypothetical protein
MGKRGARRSERSAGAFLGPDLLVPVPIHTLDEEYEDRPAEPPEEPAEEPAPEPEPPGLLRRALDRLARQPDKAR